MTFDNSTIFDEYLLGETLFTAAEMVDSVGRIGATLIQQLHYHLKRATPEVDGVRWVCMTLKDWAKKVRCVPITISRNFQKLEQLGIVISDRRHAQKWDQIKSYRINEEVLSQYIDRSTSSRSEDKPDVSIKENSMFNSFSRSSNKRSNKDINKEQHTEPDQAVVVFEKNDQKNRAIDPPHKSPVKTVNKNDGLTDAKTLEKPIEQPEIDPEIKDRFISEVGLNTFNKLKGLIAQASKNVILDALAALKHAKTKPDAKPIRSVGAWMRDAIREKWKPPAIAFEDKKPRTDPDFGEWFDLMRDNGLAFASQMIDDVQYIIQAPESPPIEYLELRGMFTLPYLRRINQT